MIQCFSEEEELVDWDFLETLLAYLLGPALIRTDLLEFPDLNRVDSRGIREDLGADLIQICNTFTMSRDVKRANPSGFGLALAGFGLNGSGKKKPGFKRAINM